jgi:hypothetical protein
MAIAADQVIRPLPQGLNVNRYLATARRQNGIDRGLLETMVRDIGRISGSLALCGWSEYAKHLVNIFGANGSVLSIADEERASLGWSFRSVRAVSLDEAVAGAPDHFVATSLEERVHYLAQVTGHRDYREQPVHLFPKTTTPEGQLYDPWEHSRFYRDLQHQHSTLDGPESMLTPQKLQLLLETAKQTLHLSGGVLEVGTWQGGSAWPLAKLLESSGLSKRLVLLDFYEELPRTNSEGVMCMDEIRHWFSFYPQAEIYAGNVDVHPEPIVSGEWCLIHYDAGFGEQRLARCFDHLQVGGIMVLDNYGHIAANPGRFDRWFQSRGHVVSSPPRSEQGWVLKHGPDG